jgi:pimeloyl-ACP methyl ester carboxylesterase
MAQPHQIRTFRDGDLTLSYEVHGSGDRTLVYLHGLLLDAAVNRRLARDLADAGNRVILLDLPGHGSSDKPLVASAHRMDAYARNVVALLDELHIDRAVVGGMSLGADVALQVGVLAPDRLAGLVIEMPVLEQATPFAAMLFTPILTATHYAAPLLQAVKWLARKIPRDRIGPLDTVFAPLTLDPAEMVAVLHGVLVGPVAPTAQERAAITVPTIVVGHGADRLHPMGDASRLAKQMPNARLVTARSIWELRVTPARLTAEIAAFLDEVWSDPSRSRRSTRRAGTA